MCDVCLKVTCPPSCPNSEPLKQVTKCDECGEPIYEGDLIWEIDGYVYCIDCIDSFQKEAEILS